MKLLILGGTQFLGKYIALAALARDHAVTLFNRANHPTPHPAVETIVGDRNMDLAKLRGRQWDAVIDTSAYLPRQAREAAEALSGAIDRYVFTSTEAVYADFSQRGIDENGPLATLTDEQLESANNIGTNEPIKLGQLYGPLKALCERTVQEVLPDRTLVIRPGLIVGPDDYTDRLTYWVARVAQGGEVLAPGGPDRFVQFIDVRDVAEFIVRMIERSETGIFNASGPTSTWTMSQVLDACRTASGSDASFTWVDEKFLLQEAVAPWSEMPLWLPDAPDYKGFLFFNSDKAVRAGLQYRPLHETIGDTFAWYRANRSGEKLRAGIDAKRERDLLRKWHEQ